MMTTTSLNTRGAKPEIGLALVPDAWTRACHAAGRTWMQPSAVVPLKQQRLGRKSGAYRLEGLDTAVIAKRCLREGALIEQQIYEQVLPTIGLPMLTFYGRVDDVADDAYCWLFIEDAGPSNVMQRDRSIVARWLAHLHMSSVALAERVALPERGPAYYLEQLRATCANIACHAKAGHATALAAPRRLLDRIEGRWDAVCEPCLSLPRTLVHGDLARKNCRLRAVPNGPIIVALDWETAGWGPPAADLADWARPPKRTPDGWAGTVSLGVYASAIARRWSASTLRQVQEQSRVGTIFRLLAAMRWASEYLKVGDGERGVADLLWLTELLAGYES